MSYGSLGFLIAANRGVGVEDGLPAGSRGEVPYRILGPFVMAGKLMSNFPPDQRRSGAATALRRFEAQASKPAGQGSVFGSMSLGYSWAGSAVRSGKWVRGQFIESNGMIVCQTKVPMFNSQAYHEAAVDAALDYARAKSPEGDMDVMQAIKMFFEAFRDNDASNPFMATLLANMAAMRAVGIEPG
jgi:hypothetical protein